jgi:hypothetical protein
VVASTAQSGQDPARDAAVALARRTLALKLDVTLEAVRLMSVAPAQWRDSSLGCPERGMVYMPVLTAGYKVTVAHADRQHVVHVAGERAVVCGWREEAKRSSNGALAGSLAAAERVRRAVAARLNIDVARVHVGSTRPARSATPPCAAATAATSGAAYVVEGTADGNAFRYYTDEATTVDCAASSPR